MKGKRLIALISAAAVVCTMLASCAKDETASQTTTQVVEVTDVDDGVEVKVDTDENATFEITDSQGNVLTIVPVYNSDGVTIIAGYVESARDKDGNELDESAYSYLKLVIGLSFDDDGSCSIMYDDDNNIVTLPALSDENGYIIAIQDTIDIDGDDDKTEYFQVVTKVDSENNLFIKLDKDDDGNLINVTVEEETDGTKTVTTSDGTTVSAVDSSEAENLKTVAQSASTGSTTSSSSSSSSSSSGSSNSSGSSSNSSSSSTDSESEDDSTVDYVAIVLQKNGKVACDADNVTVEEATALNGGSEVIIEGAGEYSKYYITSETDSFSGHLEFRFSIGEDVEVKFNDVTISTARKTAVKFTDVDKDNEKESDSEESGDGTSQSGTSVEAAAPKVELSFTGTNSFKASGSGTNGTIYSECKLAIKGHGTATIDGGQNLSGICSTESISIKNATLDITSNAKQGISCDKKVTVESGATITINSMGDGIHCNKFEYEGDDTSKIKISSLYTSNCADGIDANDWIIISGGTLEVTAMTTGKYALKVRKVIKGSSSGQFEINGGTVTASGSNNANLTSCLQKTVWVKGSSTQFTVGNYKSESGSGGFICSPCSATTVTNSAGTSVSVSWSGNIGTASFV